MKTNIFKFFNSLLTNDSKGVVELIKQSLHSTAYSKIQNMQASEATKLLKTKTTTK